MHTIPLRTLGSSVPDRPGNAVKVTELGFGAGPLGDPSTSTPDSQADEALSEAWELGVRYFDTAPWYGHTKSEHRVGRFLRTRNRDDFVLSTKVGRIYTRPDDPDRWTETEHGKRWRGGYPFVPRFDYSGSGIRRSYEDSLQRLGLNRADFLVIHDLDPRHQRGAAGVSRALEQLSHHGGFKELASMRQRGEISAIGVGINHVGMIPTFVERFDVDYFLIAMPYTLLCQAALEGELQLCEQRDIKVIVGSVFASGILATTAEPDAHYGYQPASPEIVDKVAQLRVLCGKHGVTLGAAAIQFVLAHPKVVAAIPGAEEAAQVRQNIADYQASIPSQFWNDLSASGLLHPDAPVPDR